MKLLHRIILGGGILVSAILSNLNATTLQEICPSPNDCKINDDKRYSEVINRDIFSMTNNNAIILSDMTNSKDATIDTFTNYGTISGNYNESIKIEQKGYIGNLINYGTISGHIYIGNANSKGAIGTITNYGTMGSIYFSNSAPTQPVNIVINNLGTIKAHADGTSGVNNNSNLQAVKNVTFTLQNYTIKVDEGASEFNNFSGNKPDTSAIKNSHLVIDASNDSGGVRFKDGDSKIILDFGNGFEFGEKYLIGKIATDKDGATYGALGVDFSRLMPKSDIYYLTQRGQYFIAKLAPQYGVVGNLYKSNIRTMNNFMILSNSMIYPRKRNFVILRERSERRISNNNLVILSDSEESKKKQNIDSALSLKSYESFAYQNESQNLQTRRIQRQKRNYSQTKRNGNSVILSDSEESKKKNRDSSIASLTQNDKYYFILTPFVNHNYFFESGRYNLSGFDYGFLTAFSAKVAESNSLGVHFAFSYGSLNDKHDKDLSIRAMNFMLGLNYKLDLVYDMFLKARGDFFYFLNQIKTLTMMEAIKPNNLGFGLSVSYGKDFDFKQGGILGIEGGIDYKALNASEVTLDSMNETYEKSLYHLLYADLGLSYDKYFGSFGLNANLGIKGNVTANKLAKSQIILNNFNRSVDMILDNDKVLGYANVGLSYVLNHKNFDMEFSFAYYGNFGDRIISNGGGFEWRVGF